MVSVGIGSDFPIYPLVDLAAVRPRRLPQSPPNIIAPLILLLAITLALGMGMVSRECALTTFQLHDRFWSQVTLPIQLIKLFKFSKEKRS